MSILIEHWTEAHPEWETLRTFVTQRESSPYVMVDDDPVPFFASVALTFDRSLIGYHIFLIQPIGPEMDVAPLHAPNGDPFTEAKVRALFVEPDYRGQGIGTRLQEKTIESAAELGCFQLRSRSAADRVENYRIKMKLGFACHPARRTFSDGTSEEGVYWVKRI